MRGHRMLSRAGPLLDAWSFPGRRGEMPKKKKIKKKSQVIKRHFGFVQGTEILRCFHTVLRNGEFWGALLWPEQLKSQRSPRKRAPGAAQLHGEAAARTRPKKRPPEGTRHHMGSPRPRERVSPSPVQGLCPPLLPKAWSSSAKNSRRSTRNFISVSYALPEVVPSAQGGSSDTLVTTLSPKQPQGLLHLSPCPGRQRDVPCHPGQAFPSPWSCG